MELDDLLEFSQLEEDEEENLFWDEMDYSEEECENINSYLEDEEKGVSLICSLIEYATTDGRQMVSLGKLKKAINKDFVRFTSKVSLREEGEVFRQLKSLEERLSESKKIKLLEEKTIIGLGGGFSAGKSQFINAIVQESILPESQTASTCIPTYIVNGNNSRFAYTFNNHKVQLDQEAVEALTHDFYEKYKISFSTVIKNLVIETERFPYENLIMLDTPGYSKSDNFKKSENTDAHMAKEHLKIVDYLIWVVDMDNGTIKETDLQFIKSLDLSTEILFVFNKADKYDPKVRQQIVNEAKQLLKQKGIKSYGVAIYSALYGQEYEGNYIQQFLQYVNNKEQKRKSVVAEMKEILSAYEEHFLVRTNELRDRKRSLQKMIQKSEDIMTLKAIIKFYAEFLNEEKQIRNRKYEFTKLKSELEERIKGLL